MYYPAAFPTCHNQFDCHKQSRKGHGCRIGVFFGAQSFAAITRDRSTKTSNGSTLKMALLPAGTSPCRTLRVRRARATIRCVGMRARTCPCVILYVPYLPTKIPPAHTIAPRGEAPAHKQTPPCTQTNTARRSRLGSAVAFLYRTQVVEDASNEPAATPAPGERHALAVSGVSMGRLLYFVLW